MIICPGIVGGLYEVGYLLRCREGHDEFVKVAEFESLIEASAYLNWLNGGTGAFDIPNSLRNEIAKQVR